MLPSTHDPILQPLDVSVYHPLKQAWGAVLKEFKLASMADNVTKSVFPSLIYKLWEQSFKRHHVIAGFHATGLHPLDRAVVVGKLATSAPFREPASDSSSVTSGSSSTAATLSLTAPSSSTSTSSVTGMLTLKGTGKLVIKGGCANCGAELTPMRPHLTLHFEKLLQKKHAGKGEGRRKRVKPSYYGEALTSDEVFERVKADEARKKKRRSPTPAEEPENVEESHDEGEFFVHDFPYYQVLCILIVFSLILQMRKQFVKSAARQMVMARSGSGVIHVGGGITTRVLGSVTSLQNFYVRIVHVDAPSVSQAFKKKAQGAT